MARKKTGPKQKKEPAGAHKKELARAANAATKTASRGATLGLFGHGMKRVPAKPGR